jgi:signal transduction histidine kinase
MSITSTRGHAELIKQVIARRTDKTTAEQLSKQVSGFAGIMAIHMYRLEMLMDMLQRLEDIRTGHLAAVVRNNRKGIKLTAFLEDFLEEIMESPLVEAPDPEIDYRDRIQVDVPNGVEVLASKEHLTYLMRDILRNSLMYSEPDTPITIRATMAPKARNVQIDIQDAGYGIREKEAGRVFTPFQRARQPQILAEFGYGLSLYLVKMEIEAMGGKIWFSSEEGVGTTFSFKLLLQRSE